MKTKALISCTVAVHLICAFVYAYAKSRFSRYAAHANIAGDVTVVEPVIPKFPDHCKYLLIGAGLASLSAFKAIKTQDPKAKVVYNSLC